VKRDTARCRGASNSAYGHSDLSGCTADRCNHLLKDDFANATVPSNRAEHPDTALRIATTHEAHGPRPVGYKISFAERVARGRPSQRFYRGNINDGGRWQANTPPMLAHLANSALFGQETK